MSAAKHPSQQHQGVVPSQQHEEFIKHVAEEVLFVDVVKNRADVDRALARVTAVVQTALSNAQMFKQRDAQQHALEMFLFNWYADHLHDRDAGKHDFTELYDCNLLLSILLLNHVSDPELYSWVTRMLASDPVQTYKYSRAGGKTWDDFVAMHMALCQRLHL